MHEEVAAVEELEQEPETETRVDEFAISMFELLGFKGRLPDGLAETYNEFKRKKDSLTPGRLSPEGFATVVMLWQIWQG